ncbi:MAG: hypothetical protein ABIH76_04360 [Candidatus Bathyarchaeota archaeon]
MDISEIHRNMPNVNIEGEIVDMNAFMLLVKDKTGSTFVRYRKRYRKREEWQKMVANLKTGNFVKLTECEVVNYHGILQLQLALKGTVSITPETGLHSISNLEN